MSPEYLLSSTCLYREPEKFYSNYRTNLDCRDAKPNITHKYLKELEDRGKLKAIVTQNIDGLHQKAGSTNVCEIHGTMSRCHCTECEKEYPGEVLFEQEEIPKCTCGGMLRPDVVLYGEMLTQAYSYASYYMAKAEVLIVAGTSLVVAPASGMVANLYPGEHLIIINDAETPYDDRAELVIHKPLGRFFCTLMDALAK